MRKKRSKFGFAVILAVMLAGIPAFFCSEEKGGMTENIADWISCNGEDLTAEPGDIYDATDICRYVDYNTAFVLNSSQSNYGENSSRTSRISSWESSSRRYFHHAHLYKQVPQLEAAHLRSFSETVRLFPPVIINCRTHHILFQVFTI